MAEAYEWSNPAYNHAGTIDCTINHPVHGLIPFTASPTDAVEEGVLTYNDIIASGAPITAYVPPTTAQIRAAMDPLTQRQMRLALLAAGTDTSALTALINGIPNANNRELARIIFQHSENYRRLAPSVIVVLGNRLGMTPAQIDTFWAAALLL